MTDSAHPQTAGTNNSPASRDGALHAAADAFKASLGQSPAQLPRRAENGRFLAGGDAEGAEGSGIPDQVQDDDEGRIEALAQADEVEPGAESQDDRDGDEEAGDQPQ